MEKLITLVYSIFKKVLVVEGEKVSFNKMNQVTLRLGIFVPEKLCFKSIYDALRMQSIDYNATFYQKWDDICRRSRFELFLDQLRHYASTYGTNFQDRAWLPEKTGIKEDFPIKDLKVLEEISLEEVKEKAINMAYSNFATSKEILDFLMFFKDYFEIEKIQNRELKYMCIPDDYTYKSGQECLMTLLYKAFGISMLVKNKETFGKMTFPDIDVSNFLKANKKILSSVFYRNKDVFMQLKQFDSTTVNQIRKLAKHNHIPMEKSIWLKLPELSFEERQELFANASIFKLVQMYNVLNNPTGYYIIRNGKAFYKESVKRDIKSNLLVELLKSIASKVKEVKSVALPENVELAMPSSEKNFIGDLPIGSYIEAPEEDILVGIHWRNEDGARDLDLHVRDKEGNSIGWNSNFQFEDTIIFSGDMTDADPEAAEVMYFKQPIDCIVSCSEYNGGTKYSYDMFVAKEKVTSLSRNYMVDPRSVIFQTRLTCEKRDVTLGYFKDGKFVFHSCSVGNGIVPTTYREMILNHLTQCTYLTVREVLVLAGIEIDPNSEIRLDSKGALIDFFAS
jgi:hypothetical protein